MITRYQCYCFLYFWFSFLAYAACENILFQSCTSVNGKNLKKLSGSWEADYFNNVTKVTDIYKVNICDETSVDPVCSGKAVCKITADGAISYGNLDKPPQIVSSTSTSFYLEYSTNVSCSSVGDALTYRSSVTFECGRTLGSPVVISASNCSVEFLWETSAACLPHDSDALDEVPCYAYDSNKQKRDLEFLIKLNGGHFVTDPSANNTASKDGVYINVCRNIQAHSLLQCPDDAAACLVKDGHSYTLGNLTSALTINGDNRLTLEYLAPDHEPRPPHCGSAIPRVIITFVCPGNTRGGSKPPIITSSINCQYNIEWWTEAACPVDHITSTKCGLDAASHGIDLDLSQLTKTGSKKYYEINTDNSDNTKFFLNVCSATGFQCGEERRDEIHNAVCQTTGSDDPGKIAGEADDYKVKLVDNQLTLFYPNGDKCHNGVRRMSIILFHCNATAGQGTPTFNHELHCTYYFDWHTSHACLATPQCHMIDSTGQTFDLSPLTKIAGPGIQNWEVLHGQAEEEKSKARYFLNVCGLDTYREVLRNDRTSSCPAGSSLCSVEGTSKSYGSYGSYAASTLIRQDNKLILTYNGGDTCANGKKRTTRITFYCRLGDLESSPVMKYEPSECELTLTWHTAAACPVKSVTGDNCVVSDEDSGLTFDLQSLTKPDNQVYNISTTKYTYLLNVCEKVSNTACNEHNRPVAVCQIERSGQLNHYTLGEKSRQLLYYNGFIKLVYPNGDSYRNRLYNRKTQISFLCDTKAGHGHPEFVKEGNHTYVFNWYTSLVCPAASTQCMVTDTNGDQYDLSSLSRSDDDQDENWTVLGDDVPGQDKRKYYLNVCRPVNEVRSSNNRDIGCDALAGACETSLSSSGKERISVASMGRPRDGPRIEAKNRLVLNYVGGRECSEDGVNKNFSTRIHFVCEKGALSSSPRVLENTRCSVSFEWRTEAACPIAQSEVDSDNSHCEVKGDNSKYTFNLRPLRRTADNPYRVQEPSGSIYELNICGNVSNCKEEQHTSLAGCKRTDQKYSERVETQSLLYSDDGRLTMRYRAIHRNPSQQFSTYEISFICNRSIAKGQPKFTNIDGDVTRFDFQTSLACQPEAVDCLVTDDFGNQYDLSPLSSGGQQWSVVGKDKTRRYYLSVCRPLPPMTACGGTASGACYTKLTNGTLVGHNLGLIQSNPQAISNKGQGSTVTISYMGGDMCAEEKGRRYSTRILFQCSEVEGEAPVQTDNSDPCEFYFVWQTPAACPIKKAVSSSENCAVTDPLYHMTFDLSVLTKSADYHVNTGGEWDYAVNICAKLNAGKGECENSGSCQVKSSSDSPGINDAGKPNKTLVYEDGVVTLTYLHGKTCHKTFERSTTFRFTCHHTEQKPTFINETSDCTYILDWPTPHVCPPVKVVECLAQDSGGQQYDLSALSLPGNNHVASTRGDTGGKIYYINVCRSLLHRPGVTCPPNSAACFKSKANKYHNLGEVTGGPQFVENQLKITYTNGETCIADKSMNYTTTIVFQCDINAPVDSSPVLTGGEESCHVEMLWVTRVACPVGSHSSSSSVDPEIRSPCTAKNPLTNHVFNLSSLAHSTFYDLRSEMGHSFHINVCKKVVDSNCQDRTGNCVTLGDEHYSGGEVSDQLSYNDGALSLTYRHGALCQVDRNHRHSTVISFVCHRSTDSSLKAPSAPASKPVYVNDDPHTCTHYFSWHTHLACEIQKPCAVVSVNISTYVPHIIDLSSLISESGHYLAMSELSGTKAAYYINVCRPLEPIHGVACPAGSAACEVTPGKVAKTLGHVDPVNEFLTYDDKSNTVTLRYTSSRSCATGNTNVSTHIVFSCLPGADSQSSVPRLSTITSDCVYLFEWGTDLLCSKKASSTSAPATEGCSYRDSSGNVFDLSKLETATVKDSTGTYKISPCLNEVSSSGECKGACACFTANSGRVRSLGSSKTRKISSGTNGFPVQAAFTNGSACPMSSNLKRIDILFHCIRDQAFVSGNKPTLVYNHQDQCNYTLYWPTPYVCTPPSESCVVTYAPTGATYDLSLLSSLTHSWNFKDKEGNTYFINICRPLPLSSSWTKGCKDDSTICRLTKGGRKTQSLGVLRSQKMEVTSPTTLTISYSGGEQNVCEDIGLTASTLVTFTCDRSITGAPQFAGLKKSACLFEVTWKSRIACLDEPEKVTLDSAGKFVEPKSGATIDLSSLLQKTWIAKGDLRQDKGGPSLYQYAINLRGKLDASNLNSNAKQNCDGNTAVCQYKLNVDFARKVAEYDSKSTSYVVTDESLEIAFSSSDECHKNQSKHSHVFIALRCSQYSGTETPTFVYESNECGYFFEWYTNLMCAAIPRNTLPPESAGHSSSNVSDIIVDASTINAKHSSASAVILSILIVLGFIGMLVLFLRKPERRIIAKQKMKRIFCFSCTGDGGPQYRYIRSGDINNEEGTGLFDDDDIVMKEETSLLGATSKSNASRSKKVHTSNLVSIGGAAESENSEDDIFALPDVSVSSHTKKRRNKTKTKDKRPSKAKKSSNPLEEKDDIFSLPSSKTDRSPGVGGEKVVSYHDDDDDDMLDA